jgi:hypothetical protein
MVRVSDSAARWEAQSEIASFGSALRGASSKRASEIGSTASTQEQARWSAVLSGLLPRRIGAAQMAFVARNRDDAADLRDFVGITREVALASIASAEDIDEVCEALGDALDSLHSFLVTHGLVPTSYVDDAPPSLKTRTPATEEAWDRLAHADVDQFDGAASQNDLALAA